MAFVTILPTFLAYCGLVACLQTAVWGQECRSDGDRAPIVDRYGQFLDATWPGKVVDDAQLQAEAAAETGALRGVQRDKAITDRFGGRTDLLPPRAATGYFRVEQVDGRWWFISPDGNPFIMLGVCAAAYQEWGYATPLFLDGTDISRQQLFQDLPGKQEFPEAYQDGGTGRRFNFIAANLQRKYGPAYRKAALEVTQKRLQDWGFNTAGKWSYIGPFRAQGIDIPYIVSIGPADRATVEEMTDPFDPQFREKCTRTLRASIRDWHIQENPSFIGYFYENERGWCLETVQALLTKPQYRTTAAYTAFMGFLATQGEVTYGSIEAFITRFSTKFTSFADLAATGIPYRQALKPFALRFIALASQVYHETYRDAVRELDPHHLILGGALVPGWNSSDEWILASASYVDVISIDYYGFDTAIWDRYTAAKKPLINIEFSFPVAYRGYRTFQQSAVASETDR